MEEPKTYRIGEAARMLQLKSYVLRFWETEFPQLNPERTEKGQRLYSEEDLALLRSIRHLLHERGLTIDGARKELAQQVSARQAAQQAARESVSADLLAQVRTELEAMRDLLRPATGRQP